MVWVPEELTTEQPAPPKTDTNVSPPANKSVPIWERYLLSVEEASEYFRIGRDKLRRLVDNDSECKFTVWNGSHPLIKRKRFERMIDNESDI